jgi:hypothetical protein
MWAANMAQIENWNAELRSWLFTWLQPVAIRLPVEVRARLEIEAKKRGITLTELCGTLLSVVANDGIVGAVLDD